MPEPEQKASIGPLAYTGSELEQDVQALLRNVIDTKTSFKDKHRSSLNHRVFKEMVVGVYGKGFVFGDMDAFLKRQHLYSLRAKTKHVKVWESDATVFINTLRAIPLHHDLEIFKNTVRG